MKTPVLAVFGNSLITSADGQTTIRVLPEGADITAELVKTIGEAKPSPGSLDVVYHPHELVCVVAECANLTRAKSLKYFAGEHRELTNPATSWGVTKPQSHLDGKFTTVLHYEPRPRLENVFRLLEESFSTRVRVAVPPAALLSARTRSTRLELAILVSGEDHLFYHVNENGKPAVRLVRNLETVAEHLGAALAARKAPPSSALIVCAGDTIPQPIADFLQTYGITGTLEQWTTFLDTEAVKPTDPANLAQRPFKWQPKHTACAVAAALTIAAAALAYNYGVDSYQAYENAKHVAARRAALTVEVQRLGKAKDAFMAAKEVVDAAPVPNPRPSAFLEALTQAMPPALQLQSFRYRDGQFTIEGIAYEGVGQDKGPFAQFIDSLAAGGARPWEFKSPKATLNSANWSLTGTLKP